MSNTTFPLVSIALATYNGETYLKELLASLHAQTWPNIEIIISDDQSTDNTIKILNKLPNKFKVHLIQNVVRVGVIHNFERAITACNGEYIALADQDDYWHPEKIAHLITAMRLMEKNEGKIMPLLVFSDIEIVDKELNNLSGSFFSVTEKSSKASRLRDFILSNHIPGCSMLLNRAAILKATPFPKNIIMHDWWLSMVVASFGQILYLPKRYIKYRQHDKNVIGVNVGYKKKKKAFDEVFEKKIPNKLRQADQIAQNFFIFLNCYKQGLPMSAKKDINFFKKGLKNNMNALYFVLLTHTGETFFRSIKIMRRLRQRYPLI